MNRVEIGLIVVEWFAGIAWALVQAGRSGLLGRAFALRRPPASPVDAIRARRLLGRSFFWLFLTGLVSGIPLLRVFTAYRWVRAYLDSRVPPLGAEGHGSVEN